MLQLLVVLLVVFTQAIDTNAFNNLRIYQVMVSSFQDGDSSRGYCTGYGPSKHCGDLRGIINSLQYIKDLGMNALWMTPIFNSNGGSQLDSTGYFAYDYFNVDPKFGTNDELHELINKAHSLGLYVILDGVFGHHKSGNVAGSP
ncbi:alpha-amylase, putative, partial [Entamoeba histolytica HM-1:IMSS-B]